MGKDGHFPETLLELTLTFPPARQEALWHKNCSHTARWARSDFKDKFRNEEIQASDGWIKKGGKKCTHSLKIGSDVSPRHLFRINLWSKCSPRQKAIYHAGLESHCSYCLSSASKQDTKWEQAAPKKALTIQPWENKDSRGKGLCHETVTLGTGCHPQYGGREMQWT